MLLISHVRFFPSLSPKTDWSVLRRASRWPKKLMYLPWATNDQGTWGGEEIVAFSPKNPIKRPKGVIKWLQLMDEAILTDYTSGVSTNSTNVLDPGYILSEFL